MTGPESHPGRREILLDSNVLLLWIVGSIDPEGIARFRRTRDFTRTDFEFLARWMARVGARWLASPNILTEVSNLAGSLPPILRKRFWERFRATVLRIDEAYVPSVEIVAGDRLLRLGLTDCSIVEIARRSGAVVLTNDHALAGTLRSLSLEVINFNHLRFGNEL